MNLILIDAAEVRADGTVLLSGPRGAHLIQVLHVIDGQTVRIGIVDGAMGTGTVLHADERDVQLHCEFDATIPPRPRVDLLLALPRPKVMRRLWAQLSALGVGQVILTNAEKVERDYFDSHVLEPKGYLPLLLEGLQQARDTRVPAVSIHKRFKVLIEDELDALSSDAKRLVAHPQSDTRIERALGRTDASARVLLAVGPEGGWNDFELALLEAHGFQRVGMGPRILTTTTACVALLTLVHDALAKSDGE